MPIDFPSIVFVFLFIFGTVIGSFLNVLIDRLPEGRWPSGRSMCDHCRRVLKPLELVPVLSWVVQKGRSACCRKKLSVYYPLVEVVTGVVFVLLGVYQFSTVPQFALLLVMMSSLIVIFFADVKYHIIPDAMTIVASVSAMGLLWGSGMQVFAEHVVAGLALSGLLYGLYWVTREKGLGFGDVKFAFFIGVLLGLPNGLLALYLACVLGGVVGLVLLLMRRRKLKSAIAFGPFLILGTLIMYFFEARVWQFIHTFLP